MINPAGLDTPLDELGKLSAENQILGTD